MTRFQTTYRKINGAQIGTYFAKRKGTYYGDMPLDQIEYL